MYSRSTPTCAFLVFKFLLLQNVMASEMFRTVEEIHYLRGGIYEALYSCQKFHQAKKPLRQLGVIALKY